MYHCGSSCQTFHSTVGVWTHLAEYAVPSAFQCMQMNVQANIRESHMPRFTFREMDVWIPLLQIAKFQDPTVRVFDQEVWYDWFPEYCNTCLQVGHDCSSKQSKPKASTQEKERVPKKRNLPQKIVQQWQPRQD